METDRDKLDQIETLVAEVKANQPENVVVPTPVALGPVFLNQILAGTNKDTTLLTLAPHTVVDGCTLTGSPLGQKRGIWADKAIGCKILNTTITNIWHVSDSQCIAAVNGLKDLVVDGCTLEASGENIIFGGNDSESDEMTPSDITITNCTLRKPLAWKGRKDMTCKNLFELKNARRVKVLNCTMEYSWNQGQIGFAIVLTVRNQDNTAPWSTIEDVLIKDCVVRHCAGGVQILGRDYTHVSGLMKRITFDNVQIEDIDPGAWGANGRIFQIGGGTEDVQILNSKFTGQNLNSMFSFTDAKPNVRFVVSNCFFDGGLYGIRGDDPIPGGSQSVSGVKALERNCPGYVWSNVTVRKAANAQPCVYPPGTVFV